MDVEIVEWSERQDAIRSIRERVFLIEQRLDYEHVADGFDAASIHALMVTEHGHPVACGRIKPSGHLGRVAVLMPWRGQGLGTSLIESLLREAWKTGFKELHLHALLDRASYYRRFGFVANGPVFMEGGRPTQRMVLERPATIEDVPSRISEWATAGTGRR
jgi:hypothetical protein